MDVQLNELIQKIKNEGVSQAEAEAGRITATATEQARKLVADAEAKAQAIVESARTEAARHESSAKDAIKNAARDVVLALEKKILALFKAATKEAVDGSLSTALVEKLALSLAQAFVSEGDKGIEIALSSADAAQLGASLRAAVSKKIQAGVEIIPSDRFARGIRVSSKGGALAVDFSAEALTELVADSLQPELARVLRDAK